MPLQNKSPENRPSEVALAPARLTELRVSRLTNQDEAEVLGFLAARITHSFGLIGFIRSNGLSSPENRGVFYACRDPLGRLEGVALIGHATMVEARSDAAIAAFARRAQECRDVFMLLGEEETVRTFWAHYAESGQRLRLQCREFLFEQSWLDEVGEPVAGLRLATLADLDSIVPVHARLVYEESGVNPLDGDAEGFRHRCARRIKQNRTWVWIESGKVMFKADIVTDAPEVIYLEGVDVHPDERGKGYGRRCIKQLTGRLLERTRTVILLSDAKRVAAQSFYCKAGYKLIGYYDTLFLKPDTH